MSKITVTKIIFFNIGILALMLGLLEIGARIFSNAIFLGDSKHLFDRKNKNYITNCKSCEATSFGTKIYTNSNGFRVSKSNVVANASNNKEKKIVIIGDSLGFGPGVEFKYTFQGLLSRYHSGYQFINRSVTGHSLDQHLETAKRITKNPERIEKVYLIYCLNDISDTSSTLIKKSSKPINTNFDNKRKSQWVYLLKKQPFISKINRILRKRSILYLEIKGKFSNPQERYFFQDLKNYSENIKESNIDKLNEISEILKSNGIKLTVIISPYEYQLRKVSRNINLLLPQKILSNYMEKRKINFINAYQDFNSYQGNSKDLFLPYDPMHFSAEGHKIIFDIMNKDMKNSIKFQKLIQNIP